MHVKVLLNEARGHFFGYDPDEAELHLAAEFEVPDEWLSYSGGGPEPKVLGVVFKQLNIDTPTEPWAITYRRNRNRSLSVGDVVVTGEVAWACESVGWKLIALTGVAL